MISVLLLDDDPVFLRETKEYLESCGTFDVETRVYRPEDPSPFFALHFDVIVAGSGICGITDRETLRESTPAGNIRPAIILATSDPVRDGSETLPPDILVFVKTGTDPVLRCAELSCMIRFVAHQKVQADRLTRINRLYAAGDQISEPAGSGAPSHGMIPGREEYFREFADSLPVIVADTDREGRFLYANRTLSLLAGYSPSELICDIDLYSLIVPENHGRLEKCLGALFSGGICDPEEFQATRKDGSTFSFLLHFTPLLKDGHIHEVRLIAIDISQQKEVMDALTRRETMFRMLTENSGSGFFITQGGRFRYVNPYFVRTTGYTLEDLDTHSVWDIIHPQDHDTVRQHRDAREKNPDLEGQFEIRYITKDGEDRFARITTTPISFEGKPATLGTTLDVTDQRTAQDGLRQANRKLNLLGSITRHDLLNKFSALQGYLEIIQAGIVEEKIKAHLAKQEQILTSIREQIDFAEDYEQIGIQKPTWHSLENMVREVAASLPLEAHNLSVDLKNVEVFADPLLDRVFYNLMENTIRHGSDAKEMRYYAKETPEGLRIVYEDDGIGIPHEDKENIFLRGYGENTGLGLFLIREILMITGIAIRESGDPGKGARFEILVPKGHYRIPLVQE